MKHIDGLDGLSGYLNDSAGAGRPSLLVLHEMWGLNQQVRGVVDRLAQEGFVAFGLDLYRGKVPNSLQEAEELVRTGDKAQWFADLRLAAWAGRSPSRPRRWCPRSLPASRSTESRGQRSI